MTYSLTSRISGGGATIITPHILRCLEADLLRRSGQPYLSLLYTTLCLSGASDRERTLTRELGPEPLTRHRVFPKNVFRTVDEGSYVSGIGNITLILPALTSIPTRSPYGHR
jgi:hypothetical protein